jgi:hypothetical protein
MDLHSRTIVRAPPYFATGAQETSSSLVMTWARDIATGSPVYIMELGPDRNGGHCGCECVGCEQPLRAANAGKIQGTYIQKPHFKHSAGAARDSCLVLAARAAALQLLLEEGVIDLPPRTVSVSRQGLSGVSYEGTAEIRAERRRVLELQNDGPRAGAMTTCRPP